MPHSFVAFVHHHHGCDGKPIRYGIHDALRDGLSWPMLLVNAGDDALYC